MNVIDDYLDTINSLQRPALERIRVVVHRLAPDAVETIGYGMPVFKYKGKYLIGFAGFKNHMSIFPGANPVEATKAKLAHFKTAKGTIQFTLDNPLPDDILEEVIHESMNNIKNR